MNLRERSSSGARATRLLAGYGAVACALPYFALKIVWLSGGLLGVADRALMRDPSMVALNGITAAMDLVAILLAMALTHRWGLRLPAWLLLAPMWVASGLLAKFALALPLVKLAEALASSSSPPARGGPVEPWVYTVVYTGFAGLGVGLMLAFVLYARRRWGFAFHADLPSTPRGATYAVAAPLAVVAAVMATAVGGLHVLWAIGFDLGRDVAGPRPLAAHLINAVDGLLMLAAALGILMLVHRRERPPWLALTLTWLGGGALFGWSAWYLTNALAGTALVRERVLQMPLFNLLALVQLVAGLLIGLLMLFVLAEKRPPGESAPPLED